MHRRAKPNEPLYIHISLHTPGEAASTLPVADAVAECDLDTANPPVGREYLDGDAMVLIAKNDVILCASNMHESAVGQYLRELVAKGRHLAADAAFDLLKIANKEVAQSLCAAGVKSITLDVHVFTETLKPKSAQDRADMTSARSGIRRVFNALTRRDENASELLGREDLEAAVTIRADMRRRGGADVVAGEAAERVLDLFDSGYEIETTSGIKITPDEIVVRAKYSFPAHGKTVAYKNVWDQMARFYKKILADGLNVH